MSLPPARPLLLLFFWGICMTVQGDQTLTLQLRSRVVDEQGIERVVFEPQTWEAGRTALIVCDMWDLHHCLNAVRRVGQMAPRMNALIQEARNRGVTIIHAPSECMDYYAQHPARRRAQAVPRAPHVPEDIGQWCNWKDAVEEEAGYPIDHSDGGEDDDLVEHTRWHEYLAAAGRNPKAPWKRQTALLEIDPQRDFITDDGVENWSILASRGITNVMLVGVHANMCVLGRPFGLRQLANNGINVVLVRDMTDTMYNPARPPYVSHFSGTDLVVEHIERHVCPTITSNQLLGGSEFRFPADHRPHLAALIGEDEYRTRETLPQFLRQNVQCDFRLSVIHADADDPNHFPGIEQIAEADVLLVSVRRRTPPTEELEVVREFVESGKPVVGIRTASHAFALRDQHAPPPGHTSWPEFDRQVFGGNYHGHHANSSQDDPRTTVWTATPAGSDPLLRNVDWRQPHPTTAWLYKTSPLAPTAHVLLMGRVKGRGPDEPVAWTFQREDGGRSFYTSLGHPDDFHDLAFRRLLVNGIYWAAGLDVPAEFPAVEPIP